MKKNSFSVVAAMITLALAGGVSTSTGCGGLATSSLCEDICACERCTSNDFQACKDKGAAATDKADAAGCSSEFDDAVKCAGAKVSCKSGHAEADGCDTELAALSKCSSTLSVFGRNLCELAQDQVFAKLASCPNPPTVTSGSGSGGGSVECTDAAGTLLTCQAAAFAAATCDCIGGGDVTQCTAADAKSFSDAFSLCQ
jgi:hypothetical protein